MPPDAAPSLADCEAPPEGWEGEAEAPAKLWEGEEVLLDQYEEADEAWGDPVSWYEETTAEVYKDPGMWQPEWGPELAARLGKRDPWEPIPWDEDPPVLRPSERSSPKYEKLLARKANYSPDVDRSKWDALMWKDYNDFRTFLRNRLKIVRGLIPGRSLTAVRRFGGGVQRNRMQRLGFQSVWALLFSMPDLIVIKDKRKSLLPANWVFAPAFPLEFVPRGRLRIPDEVLRDFELSDVGLFRGPTFFPAHLFEKLQGSSILVPHWAVFRKELLRRPGRSTLKPGQRPRLQPRFLELRQIVRDCIVANPDGIRLIRFGLMSGLYTRRGVKLLKTYLGTSWWDVLLGMPDLAVVRGRSKKVAVIYPSRLLRRELLQRPPVELPTAPPPPPFSVSGQDGLDEEVEEGADGLQLTLETHDIGLMTEAELYRAEAMMKAPEERRARRDLLRAELNVEKGWEPLPGLVDEEAPEEVEFQDLVDEGNIIPGALPPKWQNFRMPPLPPLPGLAVLWRHMHKAEFIFICDLLHRYLQINQMGLRMYMLYRLPGFDNPALKKFLRFLGYHRMSNFILAIPEIVTVLDRKTPVSNWVLYPTHPIKGLPPHAVQPPPRPPAWETDQNTKKMKRPFHWYHRLGFAHIEKPDKTPLPPGFQDEGKTRQRRLRKRAEKWYIDLRRRGRWDIEERDQLLRQRRLEERQRQEAEGGTEAEEGWPERRRAAGAVPVSG
eukprot:EG_transcript_4749